MKKNLFLVTSLIVLSFVFSVSGQTTQASNVIYAGSFLGSSNDVEVVFKKYGVFSGKLGNLITSFGVNSGQLGDLNTFFGVSAGFNSTSAATDNSAFGHYALLSNTLGRVNLAYGNSALRFNTSGYYNLAIGAKALYANTTGSNNIAIGNYGNGGGGAALESNTTGNFNTAIGRSSLSSNTTGIENIGLGYGAGSGNTTGIKNIFIGSLAGSSLGRGNNNIFVGDQTGANMSTGENNVYLGRGAGYNTAPSYTANNNTFVGASSGFLNKGSNNTMIGSTRNTINGALSGSGVFTGNNNTFLGNVSGLSNAALSNTIILADGSGNQRFFIDNIGNAGIGLPINILPQNKLEIRHGVPNNSGLRLTNLTSASTTNFANNGKILTVNANGDVVLTTDQGSGTLTSISNGTNTTIAGYGTPATPFIINAENIYTNNGALANDRTVTMNNRNLIFNRTGSTTGGKMYIGNTPVFPTTTGNYNLYVEGGILTEKVKVALRNTNNWADFVFEKDYNLMPLNEVENFIIKNKHLPNIPSSEKLVNEGLDLSEMQANQMQKIEELTLYAIEQNKKLETQSKEIEELKIQIKLLFEKSK